MPADYVLPDRDRSKTVLIFNHYDIGWTDIGAGSAADTQVPDGHNEIAAVYFFHFQRTGADNILADPDA